MIKDLSIIRQKLVAILKEQLAVLRVVADSEDKFEVIGTIATMQGRKKVEGIYFATVLTKPKDIRFYFFPVYTHKDKIGKLPENLQKALKGKSCFHFKYIDAALEDNLRALVRKSVQLYQADDLLIE